jgi:hypothetical protein
VAADGLERSRVDRRRPAVLDDRRWLTRQYVDRKCSTADIGAEFGVPRTDPPGEPPDPAPARRVLELPADARRQGQTFPQAWREALDVVETSAGPGWLVALEETKGEWRRCFVKVGPRLAITIDLVDSGIGARVDVRVPA